MAFRAAEKLRGAISHAVFDEVGSITCSFGVAEYIPDESVADLITRADDALSRQGRWPQPGANDAAADAPRRIGAGFHAEATRVSPSCQWRASMMPALDVHLPVAGGGIAGAC